MGAILGDDHWAGHPLVQVMYERQSASALQAVSSTATQAPPSGSIEALRHVSQASPAVVMVPLLQYSVAQAVWHAPLVPQSQAWISAMRSSSPVVWRFWQHVMQVDAASA
jgi:hypothetical protein